MMHFSPLFSLNKFNHLKAHAHTILFFFVTAQLHASIKQMLNDRHFYNIWDNIRLKEEKWKKEKKKTCSISYNMFLNKWIWIFGQSDYLKSKHFDVNSIWQWKFINSTNTFQKKNRMWYWSHYLYFYESQSIWCLMAMSTKFN